MSQWLIALVPVVLKVLLEFLFRLHERRATPTGMDKPRRRRRRRIA